MWKTLSEQDESLGKDRKKGKRTGKNRREGEEGEGRRRREKGGMGERISEMVMGASGNKANVVMNTRGGGPGSQRQ